MAKRIFIGLNNIAGVGLNLKDGFNFNGISADFYSAEKIIHPYDYPGELKPKKIPYHKNKYINYALTFSFLLKIVFKYSHFIYIQAGWTLLNNQKEVKFLSAIGKKTSIILTGCDTRIPEYVNKFKWNPCNECTNEYKQYVNCRIENKKNEIKLIERYFKHIFSPDECSGGLIRKYHRMWFPRDISLFTPKFPEKKIETIKILHAPSNSHYKGSKYIESTVHELQKKHTRIQYIEVKNQPINELYRLISECDIVIDQMLVGFYGLLSVESMALGKPVIVYIRPDIWESIKEVCPVFNSNPDNLYQVLENIILNPSILHSKGKECREFVEKYHDSRQVANYINSIID